MLDRFIFYIHQNNLFTQRNKLLIATSGGVDSVVLCHLCKQAGFDFAIAHCNFQLRGADSERDENFVQDLANQLQVPFHSAKFDTKLYAHENKLSTQVAARELRYEWFEKIRSEQGFDFILTAHHADDNIETVLMNFFRGTGINGLTGIKATNEHIRRPLLFAKRKQLETYLKDNQLLFVQDESNLYDDYTRNYFRNTLLPLITKVYPEAQQNILNNIERFKEAEILYRQEVKRIEKKLIANKGNDILIPVLLLKKTPGLRTVLLELLKPFGFNAAQLPDMIRLLDSDSGKYMLSASHRILKDRKHLIISSLKTIDNSVIVIEKEGSFAFANGMIKLIMEESNAVEKNENTAVLDAAHIQYPLLLRPWKMGDYFYPLGMQKKKKLSRFLIDKKLSLTDKEKVWVLEMNKKIVWVVGLRIDDRFKITDSTNSILKISFIPAL